MLLDVPALPVGGSDPIGLLIILLVLVAVIGIAVWLFRKNRPPRA